MLIGKIDHYMKSQIKPSPCNTNRASEIGHECLRYLVFCRTKGNERSLHSVESEYIFREGREQEKSVLRLLGDADIEVIEQQRAFDWKEYLITGHIDGKVLHEGELFPLEIKSMASWIFDKTSTLEDMLNSKYYWVRKYPAQLTLYMLMDEKERGLFLLKNKTTGRLKEIIMELDYSYGEGLIQKAEQINKSIFDKVIPEPIKWCDTCEKCGFRHICIQEILRESIEFIADPDTEEKIDGWFELKQWHLKWQELDEWRKEHFKNVEKIVVGSYLITGKKTAKGWMNKISKI